MKFDKVIPCERLKPYIRYLVISENDVQSTYKVFPSTGLVAGFQYKGRLSHIISDNETTLAPIGITGISNQFKVFSNSDDIGTILVYFTEMGLASFSPCPAHELYNESVSLDNLFSGVKISILEEELALGQNDNDRIQAVEKFFIDHIREKTDDHLIKQAIQLIYNSQGHIRMSNLHEQLHISQSALEKRFRKIVGAPPKKFASIVRFNAVLQDLERRKSLTEVCYDNNFFDQAHFIKDFRRYTGEAPEHFRRLL